MRPLGIVDIAGYWTPGTISCAVWGGVWGMRLCQIEKQKNAKEPSEDDVGKKIGTREIKKKIWKVVVTHTITFFLTGLPTTDSVLWIKMVTMTSRVAFSQNQAPLVLPVEYHYLKKGVSCSHNNNEAQLPYVVRFTCFLFSVVN